MLKNTNVYKSDIDKFHYVMNGQTVDLETLLKNKVIKEIDRYWGRRVDDYHIAYIAIKDAFIEYLEEYPGSFSFLQRAKCKFGKWLQCIIEEYELQDVNVPGEFNIKNSESDPAITLVKALHTRDWITKQELQVALGLTGALAKSVQKRLRKLCPSLYEL